MQRQINERTEKLNIVGDSMDRLEEHSSGFAEDVGKFVSNQKKKVLLGSKFLSPTPAALLISFLFFLFFGNSRGLCILIPLDCLTGIKGKWF